MPTQRLTNEIITAAIEGFEAQKKRLEDQIAELRSSLSQEPGTTATASKSTGRRGKFSDAVRLKMKEAQQRRWARIKQAAEPAAEVPVSAKPKRQFSEAGRQAIAEAARKRWAAERNAKESPVAPATKKATRKKVAVKKVARKKAVVKVATA